MLKVSAPCEANTLIWLLLYLWMTFELDTSVTMLTDEYSPSWTTVRAALTGLPGLCCLTARCCGSAFPPVWLYHSLREDIFTNLHSFTSSSMPAHTLIAHTLVWSLCTCYMGVVLLCKQAGKGRGIMTDSVNMNSWLRVPQLDNWINTVKGLSFTRCERRTPPRELPILPFKYISAFISAWAAHRLTQINQPV